MFLFHNHTHFLCEASMIIKENIAGFNLMQNIFMSFILKIITFIPQI